MPDLHQAWRAGVVATMGIALALLGGAAAAWSAWRIGTPVAHWLLGETVLAALIIANVAGIIRRAALRQRPEPPPPGQLRALRGKLLLAATAEGTVFAFAVGLVPDSGHSAWLPALIVLLVGADLLSVGLILRVRSFSAAGALLALLTAGALAALVWFPASARLGHAPAWTAVPLLAGGWVLIVAAAAGLRGSRRALGVKLV